MKRNTSSWLAARTAAMAVARGEAEADLCIMGGSVVNVYTGEVHPGNISVKGDRIAYVGPHSRGLGPSTRVIDAEGRFLVPGYIEPHTHLWTLYNPVNAMECLLPNGTTTAVSDDLGFRQSMSLRQFLSLVSDLRRLPLSYYWMVRPQLECRADRPEGPTISQREARTALGHPCVLGLAEINRWPLIYAGDERLLHLFAVAEELRALRDGHTSGASERRLQVLAGAGISACHEPITSDEVLDRVRSGFWTMLRYSSLRPDLPNLVRAVRDLGVNTQRIMLTTDGASPEVLDSIRHTAGLLQMAVQAGIPPVQALQMVTLNAATYLGLSHEIGGLAAGRRADILILPDLEAFVPESVLAGGRLVARNGQLCVEVPGWDWAAYGSRARFKVHGPARDPGFYRVSAPPGTGKTPVISMVSAVITRQTAMTLPVRDGAVDLTGHPDLIYAVLMDRQGRWVTRGIVAGLADLQGMASSFTTSGNLLVLGRSPSDMMIAAQRVSRLGGGIVLAESGQVLWEAALPVCGVMTNQGFAAATRIALDLNRLFRERNYRFHDAVYSLEFLTCDFLPDLRITARGLVSVRTGEVYCPPQPWTPVHTAQRKGEGDGDL